MKKAKKLNEKIEVRTVVVDENEVSFMLHNFKYSIINLKNSLKNVPVNDTDLQNWYKNLILKEKKYYNRLLEYLVKDFKEYRTLTITYNELEFDTLIDLFERFFEANHCNSSLEDFDIAVKFNCDLMKKFMISYLKLNNKNEYKTKKYEWIIKYFERKEPFVDMQFLDDLKEFEDTEYEKAKKKYVMEHLKINEAQYEDIKNDCEKLI